MKKNKNAYLDLITDKTNEYLILIKILQYYLVVSKQFAPPLK